MRKSIQTISRIGISVFVWFLIIVILVIISVDTIGLFDIPSLGAITTALGALGTLLLAWVTIKTMRQNENMISQREAQFRPKVRHLGKYSVNEGLNDFLVLELENVGVGKAINLQITPEIYILDNFPYQSLFEYTNQSDDIPTAKSYPKSLVTSDKNPLDYTHGGAVLKDDERNSFALRPDWANLDADSGYYDPDSSKEPRLLVFERLIRLFGDINVQELGFRFMLSYEDILGNRYEEVFIGPRFVLTEIESPSDAMGRNMWILDDESAVVVHSEGRSS